jgi:hypothetical protein
MRGPFLLGEADAHHRLVSRERDEDDAPHPELDLVAHDHLVGPRQGRGDAPHIVDGDHVATLVERSDKWGS